MKKTGIILLWIGLMALANGALGFALGFLGPILFMPEANQGPLLGIFITGPIGVIVGGVIGAGIGIKKTKD